MGAACCQRRRPQLQEEERPFWEAGSKQVKEESIPAWMQENQEAETALQQADVMFKVFAGAMAKAQAEGEASEQDPEAMAQAWNCLHGSKALYAKCAAHFETAAARLDEALEELEAQAKRTDLKVPEALVSFRASLTGKLEAVFQASARIDAFFKAAEDDDGPKDDPAGDDAAAAAAPAADAAGAGGGEGAGLPPWMVANQAAESTLQQADEMFKAFHEGLNQARARAAESQAEQGSESLLEMWTCLVGARTLFAKGAQHLAEAAAILDADIKEIKAKAESEGVAVPEALVAFRRGLDVRAEAVQEQLGRIDTSLQAIGGSAAAKEASIREEDEEEEEEEEEEEQ